MIQIKPSQFSYDDKKRHLPSVACGQRWAIMDRIAGKPADIPPTVIRLADGSTYEVRHSLAVRIAVMLADHMAGAIPDDTQVPWE
jgi:hypothetical protein